MISLEELQHSRNGGTSPPSAGTAPPAPMMAGHRTNERMVDYMTKSELLKEFDKLEKEKGVHIDGIYYNSKKSTIENAIECLKCPDELLDKYLTVVSLKYENTGRVIAENGDFKHHSHNRLYVFNTARMILAD